MARLGRHLRRMCFALFIASGSFFLGQSHVIPEPLRLMPLLGAAAGEPGLDDTRAKEVFVEAYVQRACHRFQQEAGTAPARRRREEYKRQTRQRWEARQHAQIAAD